LTPASAPPLGSAGIDQFSPAQLLRTARLFASDPELPDLVDRHGDEQREVELDSGPYLQIWLRSWPAGSKTGWHDHGRSAGAILSVRGTLLEMTQDGDDRLERTLVAGQGRSFGPNHLHQVANAGLDPALSLHLYTPRRSPMTRYEGEVSRRT
jgi:predicted metal-dependent enzyme (double-stranded beta helix superfamily)